MEISVQRYVMWVYSSSFLTGLAHWFTNATVYELGFQDPLYLDPDRVPGSVGVTPAPYTLERDLAARAFRFSKLES